MKDEPEQGRGGEMRKFMIWMAAVMLLCGCAGAYAEGAEGLTEVRCDEWRFSAKIPTGSRD